MKKLLIFLVMMGLSIPCAAQHFPGSPFGGGGGGGGTAIGVENDPYDFAWNGDLDGASKNSLYDAIEARQPLDANLTTLATTTPGTTGIEILEAATTAVVKAILGYMTSLIDDHAPQLYDDLDLNGQGLKDDFITFTDDDVAPSVAGGSFFLTGGVGADFAINDFTNTVVGKPFIVIINETVTDIDFAGAALSGHGEALLDDPPVNTMLLCIDDGATIDCSVSQPTSLTLLTFTFPLSAAPSQTAEGEAVFDTVLHVLTIGNGIGRISIP